MGMLLTAHELAKILGLPVETIRLYTRQNMIPFVELGAKQYRYEKDAVLAALNRKETQLKEGHTEYIRQEGYTYDDYLQIPEVPGYRFEILEGVLVREPSPSTQHQRISRELGWQLKGYFDRRDPEGELFFAPLDVTLTPRNVLQPDLIFVSGARREIIRPERIDGPCDLVIEIISPANRHKDRLQKMEIYRKAAIPHYWIADPEENTLEALMLEGSSYILAATGSPGARFIHPCFPELELDLDKIFRRP